MVSPHFVLPFRRTAPLVYQQGVQHKYLFLLLLMLQWRVGNAATAGHC